MHCPLPSRVDTSTRVVTPPIFNDGPESVPETWARSSPELITSPDSTASSLTKSAWKPGHLSHHDYSVWQTWKAKDLLKTIQPTTSSSGTTQCRHPIPEVPDPAFNSLEVGTIMEHAPPSWRAYVDVDLCHSTGALFMRVKDQEDALLAVSNLSGSQ
jgi:hypothetical protein